MLLQNMKIGTRLTLGFGTVILIIIFSAWFSLSRLTTMYGETKAVESETTHAITVDDMAFKTIRIMNHLLYTSTTHKQEGIARAEELATSLKEDIATLREGAVATNDLKAVKVMDDLSDAFDRYYELGKEMAFVYLTEGFEEGGKLVPAFDEAAEVLTTKMKAFRETQVNAARDRMHSMVKSVEKIKVFMLVANAFVVLLSLVLSFAITRSITAPVNHVVRSLAEIAAGGADLTRRLPVHGSDEMSILAHKFNQFADRLEMIIREFKKNAGLLKNASDDLAGLASIMAVGAGSMAEQATRAASTTEEMSENIKTLAKEADNMSNEARAVSATAEEISLNMNTVAAAVEEMDAGMRSIAENARTGSTIAGKAREKTLAVSEAMTLMDEASSEISEVSEVIKKIADKTHLLALNATIEAASAGDAGRGFAVIAGEIKELAVQSAQAAENIGRRIEGVKQGNEKVISVVSDIAATTERISEAVEVINVSIEQQTVSTSEIAASVQQFSIGVEEIASSIARVSESSTETSKVLGQTAESVQDVAGDIAGVNTSADTARSNADTVKVSAGDLAGISKTLHGIVEQFTISAEEGQGENGPDQKDEEEKTA